MRVRCLKVKLLLQNTKCKFKSANVQKGVIGMKLQTQRNIAKLPNVFWSYHKKNPSGSEFYPNSLYAYPFRKPGNVLDECWMTCTLIQTQGWEPSTIPLGWMDGWCFSPVLSVSFHENAEFRQSENPKKIPTFCPCTWQILAAGF